MPKGVYTRTAKYRAAQSATMKKCYAEHPEFRAAMGSARKGKKHKKHKKHVMKKKHYPEHSISMKKYCAEHPGVRAGENNHNYKGGKSKYSGLLTEDEYNDLLKLQHGVCAICGKLETRKRGGKIYRLAIDHNHKTGRIRGLLCARCNIKLGLLDDLEFIIRANLYLNEKRRKDKHDWKD